MHRFIAGRIPFFLLDFSSKAMTEAMLSTFYICLLKVKAVFCNDLRERKRPKELDICKEICEVNMKYLPIIKWWAFDSLYLKGNNRKKMRKGKGEMSMKKFLSILLACAVLLGIASFGVMALTKSEEQNVVFRTNDPRYVLNGEVAS